MHLVASRKDCTKGLIARRPLDAYIELKKNPPFSTKHLTHTGFADTFLNHIDKLEFDNF